VNQSINHNKNDFKNIREGLTHYHSFQISMNQSIVIHDNFKSMRKKISIHYCSFEIRVNQLIEISNDFKERRKSLTSTIVHFKLKSVDRLIALIIISYNFKDKSTSTGALQTVNIYCEKVEMCCLAQEIGYSAPNSCSLPWLLKGATELRTSEKECNKLDLTAAQYF
jgi:hypothetical protein